MKSILMIIWSSRLSNVTLSWCGRPATVFARSLLKVRNGRTGMLTQCSNLAKIKGASAGPPHGSCRQGANEQRSILTRCRRMAAPEERYYRI
jgi:hypothetical protein